MFCWKGHFFQTSVFENTSLKVEWCSAFGNNEDQHLEESACFSAIPTTTEGENCFSFDSDLNSKPEEIPLFYQDTYDLGKENVGKVLKTDYSFDCFALCRVPVILIEIQNASNSSDKCNVSAAFSRKQLPLQDRLYCRRLLLFGIADKNEVSIPSPSGKNSSHVKRFSILPLRFFSIKNLCDRISHDEHNIKFVSNFGFFYYDKNQPTLTFKLYFGQQNKSTETMVQKFMFEDGIETKDSRSDVRILDIFNSFLNQMFLMVVRWTSVESLCNKCGVFLFYNLKKSKYEMKKVATGLLFPEEFAEIAVSVIFSSTVLSMNSPRVKSASLLMLSTTNYAIKFSQGNMTHRVSLDKTFHMPKSVSQQVDLKGVTYICDGVLKTALQVKDKCVLLDWIDEKASVVQSENVQAISRCDNNGCTEKRMLLSMAVKSSNGNQELGKWTTSIVNVCDIDNSKMDDGNVEMMDIMAVSGKDPLSSPPEIRDEIECEDFKINKASENVLRGLMFQEKKCQMDLFDLEQSLRCKETFIQQTVTHFSHVKADPKTGYKMKYFDMPPLVPLTGHIRNISGFIDEDKATHRHWKVEKLWKRTINRFLVCGVDLIKTNDSRLCDIYLVLVPINHCSATVKSKSPKLQMCPVQSSPQSVSKREFSSPPCKRTCFNIPQTEVQTTSCTGFKTPIKVAAFINTQDFWGCEDITVQVYLAYSILAIEDSKCAVKHFHQFNCGIISVSLEEKLGELCNLRSHLNNKSTAGDVTLEDMIALDCVQTSLDLKVCSALSPVTSLLQKVQTNPSIVQLSSSDHYIYSADHSHLQFCRMEWVKRVEKSCAIIRIHSCSKDSHLLFIEFLQSISPSDFTFSLQDSATMEEVKKAKTMNQKAKELYDNIEEMISQENRAFENLPEKYDEVDVVEIIDDILSSSPKFHSSIQKTEVKPNKELKNYETVTESTFGSAVPVQSKVSWNGDKKTSRVKGDLILFDFEDEFEEDCSKSKKVVAVKKGGKSKLTMKKK